MAPPPGPAIITAAVRKSYGSTVALDDVSLEIPSAHVHALLGENGAGKSTMVKLLSGLIRPDSGRINIFGEPAAFRSPRDAHRCSIQTAFQELTLVPDLTVWENVLLPYQPTGFAGLLRARKGEAAVAALLSELGIAGVSPRQMVRDLDLPLRQKIEIARTLLRKPRILLLDEPTSALSGGDVDWLAKIVADQKRQGTTVVFISHRMPEVRRFCDGLTILRNGRKVGSYDVDTVSDHEVVELIIGRSLVATFPPKPPRELAAPPVLSVDRLAAGRLQPVSFDLHAGEILGVAALQGMGQLELFLALFGDVPTAAGGIRVDGRPVVLRAPSDAVRSRVGIALVPEDRKTEGLFLKLDGRRNTSLPVIHRFTAGGLINRVREQRAVTGALGRVQVDQRALHTPAGAFSGGNQQKIVLAKWILAGSRVLLLFDPTRGVDVGTKHEIYLVINDYARAGGAVLLYSTEIAEVVNLSHRVLVIYGGRIVQELDDARGEISESAIMRAALGHVADPEAIAPAMADTAS
jgi:ribose transport system ATP-binding protein